MNLTDGLTEHLQTLSPPQPDLDRVVRAGTRRRRVRRTAQAAGALLTVGVLAGTTLLVRGGDTSTVVEPPPLSTGPMDLSEGLRAYADPGRVVVLGGRTVSAEELSPEGMHYLDTDAVATKLGVVYFRAGRPWLLTAGGTSRSLWSEDAEAPQDWHPTAKADGASDDVAFAVRSGGEVRLVVRDLASDEQVSTTLDCGAEPGCAGVKIDAVDSGTVLVRTKEGTFRWEYAERPRAGLTPFAGPDTRVADARSRTVLYDGPRPTVTLEGWTYVAGAIDAQLTFDGRNILYWSPVLEPVSPGGEAIRLDVPKPATFFTFDTDGSVLAASTEDPTTFFDCEIPSGACEPIGRLQMTGGDPQFIGNDM